MKKILLVLSALLMASVVSATIKMNSTPVQVTQSDGTQLTVIGYGDDKFHYFTTTDGMLLVHEGNNFYVAAVTPYGQLKATRQLAHEKTRRSTQEQRLCKEQNRELFFNHSAIQRRRTPGVNDFNPEYPLFPCKGEHKVLVLLVEFQDQKFMDEEPIPVFLQYFNADKIDRNLGNGTARRNFGSVGKYYRDMSFGQFNPKFDVYGPITLSQPMAYYGADVNIGTEEEPDVRVDYYCKSRLIPEACRSAEAQGVDFSQYDEDGDGYVDLLYILYSGYAQSWAGNSTNCIWPKTGTYESGPYNGKTVRLFSMNSELNAFPGAFNEEVRINGVGLACHEFAHCLGLPDIYPTSTEARNAYNPAMEYWDLMDAGEYVQNGYYPTELTAWEREALGWMEITTLRKSGHYELPPISEEQRMAYRILNDNDPTRQEYILLQNVQDTLWNRRQQGHGMLIMHVDYDQAAFSLDDNAVNNEVGHPRFTYIPADGEYISQYAVDDEVTTTAYYRESHWGDPYPGTSEVTEIPSFEMYTGIMNKQISGITETVINPESPNVFMVSFDFQTPELPTGINEKATIGTNGESPSRINNEDLIYDLQGRRIPSSPNTHHSSPTILRRQGKWMKVQRP